MIGTKICRRCGEDKPLSDFHKCKKRKDGVQTECKECMKLRHAEYYSKHIEQYKESHERYRETHYLEMIRKSREYYHKNKERVTEKNREYYQSHKEQYNTNRAKWRENNKDKLAAYARKSRQNPVKREKSRLLKVIRRVFDYKGLSKSPTTEAICGCTPMELYTHLCSTWEKNYGAEYNGEPCEIDHICPLRNAKTIDEVHELYKVDNLQLLTKTDNRVKG